LEFAHNGLHLLTHCRYPHKFNSTLVPAEFHKKYEHVKSGEMLKEEKIELGARIMTTRSYGNKLRFYDVKSGTGAEMKRRVRLRLTNRQRASSFRSCAN